MICAMYAWNDLNSTQVNAKDAISPPPQGVLLLWRKSVVIFQHYYDEIGAVWKSRRQKYCFAGLYGTSHRNVNQFYRIPTQYNLKPGAISNIVQATENNQLGARSKWVSHTGHNQYYSGHKNSLSKKRCRLCRYLFGKDSLHSNLDWIFFHTKMFESWEMIHAWIVSQISEGWCSFVNAAVRDAVGGHCPLACGGWIRTFLWKIVVVAVFSTSRHCF